MGKNLSMLLNEARYKGVQYGTLLMSQINTVGNDNILTDYISEDKMPEVLSRLEAENQRILDELLEKHSVDDATDILIGHASEIKRKWGICK